MSYDLFLFGLKFGLNIFPWGISSCLLPCGNITNVPFHGTYLKRTWRYINYIIVIIAPKYLAISRLFISLSLYLVFLAIFYLSLSLYISISHLFISQTLYLSFNKTLCIDYRYIKIKKKVLICIWLFVYRKGPTWWGRRCWRSTRSSGRSTSSAQRSSTASAHTSTGHHRRLIQFDPSYWFIQSVWPSIICSLFSQIF